MKKVIAILVLGVLLLAGCSDGTNGSASRNVNRARRADENTSARVLSRFQKTQPVPERPWSQLRQNLIEIEEAQMDTTQTTTFFFNMGVPNPVLTCPSIGFPIPSTAQLTNPQAKVRGASDAVIAQLESNGVYTGDSTGTYAICVSPQGKAYAVYWEGFVYTATGPATWDGKQVQLIGPPSHKFSASKRG